MDEKILNERESIALITQMIQNTRQRLTLGVGNIFLLWGYLVVAVSLLVCLATYFIQYHAGWLWFLIPVIGIPVTIVTQRKKARRATATSYSDRLSSGLWRMVLYLAFASMAISAGFVAAGFNVWIVMMLFGYIIIGFATAVQGMIINEKSLIFGGSFGILVGGFLCCGMIGGATHLMARFAMPLYVVTYIVMMIIPGHILNYKAKKSQQ